MYVARLGKDKPKNVTHTFHISEHLLQGEESKENEEKYVIEISCLLERFCRHAPLSWEDVAKAADKVN